MARPGESADDCVLVEHSNDCCGTILYMGIAESALEEFEGAEATCRAEHPEVCDCKPRNMTEDGERAPDRDEVIALCTDGTCSSASR